MRANAHRRTKHAFHELARTSGNSFRAAVLDSGLSLDEAQIAAVNALSGRARHGYYLWGDVGRGKSLISEMYFAAIPTRRKRRFHFHDFFRGLQTEITSRREPLEKSLQRLVGDARAILFDEFHVHDVADGVYLSATLKSLLDSGTFLLATSNYAPEDLMPNPLYHEQFRPAITIISTQLEVVQLGPGQDYRAKHPALDHGFGAGTWSTQTTQTETTLTAPHVELEADGHIIRARDRDGDTGVFTFSDLCAQPLGVAQYLWLAEHFRTIALTEVPDLGTVERDSLARFSNLIDVLYDRDILLNVSAAGTPEGLLRASEPPRDAQRTVSRLSMLHRRSMPAR